MKPRTFVSRLYNARLSMHVSLTYDNIPLEDTTTLIDGFLLWMLTIRDLLPETDVDSHLIQLYFFLVSCDVLLLSRFLKDASNAVRHLPRNSSLFTGYFKGTHLGGKLISSHLMVLIEKLDTNDSARYFRSVLTILEYPARINATLPIEEKLQQEYEEFENELSSRTFDPDIIRSLGTIVSRWLGAVDFSDSYPRHGPGSIAGFVGKIGMHRKTMLLGTDLRLQYAIKEEIPMLQPHPYLERISELLFVPKSMNTYRTICREPVTLQFWQQFVAAAIVKSFPSELKKHVNLEDQTVSRRRAKRGSITLKHDTIDLSNASDSVHVDLVKGVFRKTGLLRYLIGTRADKVKLPDGKIIPLKKFAPMGSALCFPIECIIFAAICEHGYSRAGISPRYRDYVVYGDDIICHRDATPHILELLSLCGFTPNLSKTFSGTVPFRESCGGEYYAGEDVTPLRISRRFKGLDDLICNPERGVDLANAHYARGILLPRRVLLSHIRMGAGKEMLFTFEGGPGIWTDFPTNYHLKFKWSARSWTRRIIHRVRVPSYESTELQFGATGCQLPALINSLLKPRVLELTSLPDRPPDVLKAGLISNMRWKYTATPEWSIAEFIL